MLTWARNGISQMRHYIIVGWMPSYTCLPKHTYWGISTLIVLSIKQRVWGFKQNRRASQTQAALKEYAHEVALVTSLKAATPHRPDRLDAPPIVLNISVCMWYVLNKSNQTSHVLIRQIWQCLNCFVIAQFFSSLNSQVIQQYVRLFACSLKFTVAHGDENTRSVFFSSGSSNSFNSGRTRPKRLEYRHHSVLLPVFSSHLPPWQLIHHQVFVNPILSCNRHQWKLISFVVDWWYWLVSLFVDPVQTR
jgi:hypothetical protein